MKSFSKVVDTYNKNQLDDLLGYIQEIPEGTQVRVSIKKYRKNRSLDQNAYYWGVVLDICSKHLGYEAEELHELFKQMFNSKQVQFGDETFKVPQSTTDTDTYEFSQYIEKIRDWAAQEIELFIPSPSDKGYEF